MRNKIFFRACAQPSFFTQDEVELAEKALKPVKGSYLEFFKNGVSQGRAWEDDVFGGVYYPCVSLYKSATVTVNFGPDFKFPPATNLQPCSPVSNRAYETMLECCVADLVYAVEVDIDGDRP